ncbi:Colicin I receptor, partial [termite gut metagenome]
RISNDMTLGESNFELMGMSGNNVKVLMDGVPLIDRGATKQSLSQIDINSIDQIEIVEGPMSVIYGTDALAGVINIITKKAQTTARKNSFSVSARVQEESIGDEYKPFSGEGTHNESMNVTWASKTGAYLDGSYSRNITGGWIGDKTGREKMWPPKDQFLYSGTVGYKKENLNVWYRLGLLDETIFTPVNPTTIDPNRLIDRNYVTDRYTHSLQGDWKPNSKWRFNVVSSYQDYKRRTRTIITDADNGNRWLSAEASAQDISKYRATFVRATAAWIATRKLSLQPGIEYNYDVGSGERIGGEPGIGTLAAFLSAEWQPLKGLNIRPGVRTIVHADYDAPVAIPSLGAKYALNSDMDIRLSYAYGFRAPTLQELYFSFHNANHNIDGNPDLEAEYSNNFTGSFSWRILHKGTIQLMTTLSGFYNDFRDRITMTEDMNNSTHFTYYNIDRYKTMGGTWENALMWQNLQVNIGLSLVGRYNDFVDNESFKEESLPTFRFSPEITGSVTYRITKIKTYLNLFYKYTGGRKEYRYNDETKDLYLGGLSDFHWADFTVSRRAGKYLHISAGIKNLFDVTTVRNTSGGSGHDAVETASLLGCGRSYFIGLNFLLNQ